LANEQFLSILSKINETYRYDFDVAYSLSILSKINSCNLSSLPEKMTPRFQFYPRSTHVWHRQVGGRLNHVFQFYPRSTFSRRLLWMVLYRTFNSIQDQLTELTSKKILFAYLSILSKINTTTQCWLRYTGDMLSILSKINPFVAIVGILDINASLSILSKINSEFVERSR